MKTQTMLTNLNQICSYLKRLDSSQCLVDVVLISDGKMTSIKHKAYLIQKDVMFKKLQIFLLEQSPIDFNSEYMVIGPDFKFYFRTKFLGHEDENFNIAWPLKIKINDPRENSRVQYISENKKLRSFVKLAKPFQSSKWVKLYKKELHDLSDCGASFEVSSMEFNNFKIGDRFKVIKLLGKDKIETFMEVRNLTPINNDGIINYRIGAMFI